MNNSWYICTGNSPVMVNASSSGQDDPPTDLVAITLSSTSIRVTWGPPEFVSENKTITYNVSYDAPHEISMLTNDTIIELVDLEKGMQYFFTVEAVYDGITCGYAEANATTIIGK